ncbi:MAG: hypothetical protein KDC53_23695, partial [Saprospiraceae bacterium]|nr:hypothetical protein [Saprospiraceae bacterium]
EIAPVSLMPTGILNTLSEGEIVNLLSYLMQAES